MAEIMGFIKMAVTGKSIMAVIAVLFFVCVAVFTMAFVSTLIVAAVRAKKDKVSLLEELKVIWF